MPKKIVTIEDLAKKIDGLANSINKLSIAIQNGLNMMEKQLLSIEQKNRYLEKKVSIRR